MRRLIIALVPCLLWIGICVGGLHKHTSELDNLIRAYADAGGPEVALEPGVSGHHGWEAMTPEQWFADHPKPEGFDETQWQEFGREIAAYQSSMAAYAKAYNAAYGVLNSLKSLWWPMMLIPLPAIFYAFWKRT